LAARGQLRLHRTLGTGGGILAAVVVMVGLVATFVAAGRGFDLSGDLVRFDAEDDFIRLMSLPFGDGLLFGIFVAAALYCRRRAAVHKRLMLFAIFGGLMGAPIAHIMGHFSPPGFLAPLLILPMLFSSAVNDKLTRGRVHPVSWVAPLLIIAFNVGRDAFVRETTAWHDFVRWVVE
jgi:hypothetical protein